MKKLNVMSLFDGNSGGQLALEMAGIKVGNYYASEIDEAATGVTNINWEDTINLGCVTSWREWDIDWSSIDLLIGGSPCQGFSFSGKQLNFNDPRSKLFFVYVEILNHIRSVNPKVKFLLENVIMQHKFRDVISEYLGCEPVEIRAELLSPCYRPRNYWANFKIEQPKDQGIFVRDVITDEFIYPASITGRKINPETGKRDDYNKDIEISQYLEVQSHGKARCVTTVSKDCVLSSLPPGKYKDAYDTLTKGVDWREPTIDELCVFHGITKGYFASVIDSKARKMIGNGWNIYVVAFIFKGLLN